MSEDFQEMLQSRSLPATPQEEMGNKRNMRHH